MVKKAFFFVSLLVGLALLAFVVAHLRLERIPESLGEIGWLAVLAYVANASLTLVIPAISWAILMRSEGMRVSYWTALKANLMGWPLNFVTPTLYLGGEPLKTFYIASVANEPKRRVLATIIVAKFQEFGALLLVMLVAAGISIWRIELTPRDEVLTLISIVILSALFGLTLYAFIRNLKPTVRFITFLARLGLARRRLARLRSRARDMEQIIHRAFTKRWKTTLLAQAITLLSAVAIWMRAWVFFYFAGKVLDTGQICGIYVITYIANSLPVPGGLGTYEGGMALYFSSLGLPENDLGTFLLLNRAADIFLVLLGLYFIVRLGLQSVAGRVAKGQIAQRLNETRALDGDEASCAKKDVSGKDSL